MGQKIILVLAIVFSAGYAHSQATFGVKGGLNIARWNIGYKPSSFENKSRTGMLLGVNVEFPVKEPVTIQAELLYAMFGANFRDHNEYAHYKTSYLLLPVLAKYNFNNNLSVYAGPQLGLLMSAKSVIDGDKYNFKDEMKGTDIFLVIGGEYHLRNAWSFGLRFQHGLTNTEDGASTTIHNRGFALTANYRLKGTLKEIMDRIF